MVRFRHICSLTALFSILTERRFKPAYSSPIAGDSGINGYIEGDSFNRAQEIKGHGVELIIEWTENIIDDSPLILPYPLPPNTLIRQGAWRTVIPCNTSSIHIKVIGFEVEESLALTLHEKKMLCFFQKEIEEAPIFLILKA